MHIVPRADILAHAADRGNQAHKPGASWSTSEFELYVKSESPRVSWRLGYLEPAPVGTGASR